MQIKKAEVGINFIGNTLKKRDQVEKAKKYIQYF